MSQATFIIGDVLDVLRSMPDDSVDMVMTSPPFLALRSYLPADHPDKGKEIGSEPTPGAFIDALLDVTEELARVVVPHGSICIELGDTYSGSGGAGGDYGPDGLHEGQPVFRQARTDGAWPEAKSLCLIPELYRFALAYGFNPLTGRQTPTWRVRNVVRWHRPNPPVGALGDKFRPSTSDMVVACKARDRYFDLDPVRVPVQPGSKRPRSYAPGSKTDQENGRARVNNTNGQMSNPAGAPPLDTWVIPTAPFAGSHYATFPPALCVKPILTMCPPDGTVLDPFAGSGTTLAVATGHGRNAVGIDIDGRNADLCRQRVGMFLTVEYHVSEVAS